MGNMKNFKFSIDENQILRIEVDLKKECGLSKSGQSVVISSSGGFLKLIDSNGYRNEKVNCSVTRPAAGPDGE
jgi:hypothetical protein